MSTYCAVQSKEDENIVDKASDAVKNVAEKVKEAVSGNADELAGKVNKFTVFL